MGDRDLLGSGENCIDCSKSGLGNGWGEVRSSLGSPTAREKLKLGSFEVSGMMRLTYVQKVGTFEESDLTTGGRREATDWETARIGL